MTLNLLTLQDNPVIYALSQFVVGGFAAQSRYIKEYVRPKKNDRILDIGCGTGDILRFLSDVKYVGFDMHQRYIDSAKRNFGNRGTFLCKKVSKDLAAELSEFDIVLAYGVLHHLSDNEALQLFELARSVLKPQGRLVTLDGCYTEEQSLFRRYLLSKDRGRYVRTKKGYFDLISKVFTDIKMSIRNDFLRIPYTHIIMECVA